MQTVSEKLKELQKVLQPSPLSPINKVYLFVWAYFSIDFLRCFIISRPRWIWPDGSISAFWVTQMSPWGIFLNLPFIHKLNEYGVQVRHVNANNHTFAEDN